MADSKSLEDKTLPAETSEAKTLPTKSAEDKALLSESSESSETESSEDKPVQAESLPPEISEPRANSETLDDDSSKVKTFAYKLDGIVTDFLVCDYKEKQLIVISQTQEIGPLYLVFKCNTKYPDGMLNYYHAWILCGTDVKEYHLVARFLVQELDIKKPVLCGLSLKDSSMRTLNGLVKAFKQQGIV